MDRLRAFVTPSQVVRVSLGADAPVSVLNYTAKSLYQTQDNLQAVVNFLSNSIAQLPIKVYKRGADDERMRDRESAAAKLLWKPNEDQTAYEFIVHCLLNTSSSDVCMYGLRLILNPNQDISFASYPPNG